MELEILSQDLKSLGLIDNAKSVIWHRKFFEAGLFEVYIGATDYTINLLQEGNFVTKENSFEVGIITYINIVEANGESFITARGRFLSFMLSWRNIDVNQEFNQSTELTMRTLVSENAISPTDTNKIIPNLSLGELKGFTDLLNVFTHYDNLYEFLCAMSQACNIGFGITYKNGRLEFETYKGIDRSINQEINPHMEFSKEYENLLTCQYTKDTTNEINLVTAYYDGQYGKTSVTVGDAKGISRKETYISCECVTKEVVELLDIDGNTATHTEIDFEKTKSFLRQEAEKAMIKLTEYFNGDASSSTVYKVDYDLGDIVTVKNEDWGKEISNRIYEIIEVDDENGYSIKPVFGSPQPKESDILKKEVNK